MTKIPENNTTYQIAAFDIDGVIFNGHGVPGVYPGPRDVIITGRSFEEENETVKMLLERGITNKVYFNDLPFNQKTRESSGIHKANTINRLQEDGLNITVAFEDDPIQATVIEQHTNVYVIQLDNPMVEKENKRQDEWKE